MLKKFGGLGRTTQPNCARSIAASAGERRDASRRGGASAPGRCSRARGERRGRLAAARPPVAHRLREGARILLVAGAVALAAVFVAPTGASAATYPPGFSERRGVLGSGQSNRGAVRLGRTCLRCGEERPDKGLRLAHGHDADRVRRSQRQRLQLLGPRPARTRAGPELPHQPVRVRPLCVRPRARQRGAGATLGHPGRAVGSMPDPARADRRRLHGERAPVAPSGVRQHDDRVRAGADRGLVPAISEPLDRRARLRAGRGALRVRRRRRKLQLRRLGTGRQPR